MRAIRDHIPDTPYKLLASRQLVGLFSLIFVKDAQSTRIKDVAIDTVKTGMKGNYGNKVYRIVYSRVQLQYVSCSMILVFVSSILILQLIKMKSPQETMMLTAYPEKSNSRIKYQVIACLMVE